MQIPIQLRSRHPARNPLSLKNQGLRRKAGASGPGATDNWFSGCCRGSLLSSGAIGLRKCIRRFCPLTIESRNGFLQA
jgi:hypothetical protein